MYPEDRLDALLSARRRAEGDWRRDRAKGDAAGDDELVPLLESADRLAPLRAVRPDRTFAQALEAQMLDRATKRRRAGRIDSCGSLARATRTRSAGVSGGCRPGRATPV